MKKQRNARFWEYINGDFVKLTLRPGQVLHWSNMRRTDEGHQWEYATWAHHGDHIGAQLTEGGIDCDGRTESEAEYRCDLDRLAALGPEPADEWAPAIPYARPDWIEESASVYDQFARLAGY